MNNTTEYFLKTFGWKSDSKTDERFVYIKNNIRFSVLTSRLLRVEYNKNGSFTDEPTQSVINRNFDKPDFDIKENGDAVIISTSDTVFEYDTAKRKMASISLVGGKKVSEFKSGNLKGTYRTLDDVDGRTKIGNGLMSKDGVSVIDDSKSLILNEDGTIGERMVTKDEYYFAYGHDYRGCLKDFFSLCGQVPLVPRYCLGNWWSRYKAYTQQEYKDLMQKFINKGIPLTVATIDMDWHWVDVKKRFGNSDGTAFEGDGWTGYSWNTELFPDYKEFLKWLKDKNLRITVNLHPAQGIRFFEDMYEDVAKAMGVDPATRKTVEFDITDPKFVDAYFNLIHKPYVNDGVDFWWIDWQQGKNSKMKNLDPLWALNHYHTLANETGEKRPLILSRFAEVGSHRYPLGFSGDTHVSWKSLRFQPYFTNTATNVGYTWWSHDIGGHMRKSKDDELYIRWVQYGLFNPIMRLHSTNNEFMGKEPWKHNFQAEVIVTDCLRQRHSFIPYLYSMNYRTHKNCIALCEPMYYEYPEASQAYEVKNQYLFGSELMVAPITRKINSKTYLASTEVWLPDGRWTDIYTGAIYNGGQKITMYRGIESIPVLAKEGAIIPLSANDRDNSSENPSDMVLRIYRGNNTFELYEDDGFSNEFKNGNFAITKYTVSEKNNTLKFDICAAEGDCTAIPCERNYTLIFEDVADAEDISVKVNGKKANAEIKKTENRIEITLNGVSPKDSAEVIFESFTARTNRDKREAVIELVTKYQLPVSLKADKFNSFINNLNDEIPMEQECFRGPIEEVLKMA